MFPKRPNIEEDEDDLLAQQNELLNKSNSKVEIKEQSPVVAAFTDSLAIRDNHDHQNIVECHTTRVVERDVGRDMLAPGQSTTTFDETGFPQASKLSSCSANRATSLYAQKHLKRLAQPSVDQDVSTTPGLVLGSGLGGHNWQQEMNNIKKSNDDLLKNMSKEEIEQMRQMVMHKLSPATVSFLTSKQFPVRSHQIKQETGKIQEKKDIERETGTKMPIPVEEIKSKGYVNMDVIEHDKLKWIGDVAEDSKTSKTPGGLMARFNFEGELMQDNESIDTHYGLHHHGEEPERAGYNINELFLLLQSTYPSQKQLALSIMKRIVSKAHVGYYDCMLNHNLEDYLLRDTLLVLIVRTCLDDNNPNVWKTALSTLKTIVCNTHYDEIYLDRAFLLLQVTFRACLKSPPNLTPMVDARVEFNETMTDEQWASHDIVDCLVQRASILSRLDYLVKTYHNDTSILEDVLDILLRIARHSPGHCHRLFTSNQILHHLSSCLLGASVHDYRAVHVKMLKLIRVCLSSLEDKRAALKHLEQKMMMLDVLKQCLLIDLAQFEAPELRLILGQLIIESQRLWITLLIFSPSQSVLAARLSSIFAEMKPTILKQLHYCQVIDAHASSFDYQYASYLVTLTATNMNKFEAFRQDEDLNTLFMDLLSLIASKWLTILTSNGEVASFDLSLCLCVIVDTLDLSRFSQLADLLVHKMFNKNEKLAKKLIASCMDHSNFNPLRVSKKGEQSCNLPSFGSLQQFGRFKTIPVFSPGSPVLLLYTIIRSMNKLSHTQVCLAQQMTECVDHYTDSMCNPHHCPCIFDVIEFNFMLELDILLARHVEHDDNNSTTSIASSLLSNALIVHRLQSHHLKKLLIDNVLFNISLYRKFYDKVDENRMDSFKMIYAKYSTIDSRFWIFDPIIQSSRRLKISLDELVASLEFIYMVVKHFKDVLGKMGLTPDVVFVCLCSVFCIDEDSFFHNQVQALLQDLLVQLKPIKCSKNIEVPFPGGMINFLSRLASQYDSCSYGNAIFAQYLSVFLEARSDVEYRQLFESEFSHLVPQFQARLNV